jgi:hypothetical protein
MDNNPPQTPPQVSPPVPQQETKTATPEESKQELQDAIKGSNQILVKATTKLTFFPDTLTLDRAKLSVTKRTFVQVSEVMSIRIEDILNVTASLGPMFGSVKIISRVMNADNVTSVGRFSRVDALRVKHITQGYVIALQRGIDCNALQTRELAAMLERLGEDDHPS